jgi:hypothetical protein
MPMIKDSVGERISSFADSSGGFISRPDSRPGGVRQVKRLSEVPRQVVAPLRRARMISGRVSWVDQLLCCPDSTLRHGTGGTKSWEWGM